MSQPLRRRRHREVWPWLLAVPPLFAVLGGLITIWLAVATPNPMVRGDYGKSGLKLEQDLTRDRRAADLGLVALLRFGIVDRQLEIELSGAAPGALILHLWHPTRAEFDVDLRLAPADRHYRVTLPKLPDDRWYLELEPEDRSWRLAGSLPRGATTARLAAEDR